MRLKNDLVSTSKLCMFAGPNGSGKTTMVEGMGGSLPVLFLNADNLEKQLKINPILDLSAYDPRLKPVDLISKLYGATVSVVDSHGNVSKFPIVSRLPKLSGGLVNFKGNRINSYLAARIIDFVRYELLKLGVSFTFETVMSHESKIEFMRVAKKMGYEIHFYFIATEDPMINVERVALRVNKGGHGVGRDKIIQRYHRTIALLNIAVAQSDRAFVYDNSITGVDPTLIAEIYNGVDVSLRVPEDALPNWFR